MGSCVSTPNGRHKSRKFCLRSRKCCGKVSASVPDARTVQISDAGNCFARSEFVHLQTSVTSRRKSEVSNLAFHLTQLQWHHTKMNAGNVICQEEAWLNSVGILESDCDNDFNSVNGDLFPAVTKARGSQMLQYEDDSVIVVDMHKFEELPDNSPVTLAVEEYLKRDVGKSWKILSEDELQESNRMKIKSPAVCDIASGEVDKEELRMQNTENLTETEVEEFCWSSEGSKLDRLETQGNCTPPHISSANSSNKIQPFPSARAGYKKRKSAVIQFSLERKSYDGQEGAEICSSTRCLYHPRAGILVPWSPGEESKQRCWSILEPSSFKLCGDNYFRDKKKSHAPDYSPYISIGIDMLSCRQEINHLAQHIELPPVKTHKKFPSLFIVNIHVPTYPASIFLGNSKGEGSSWVLYFEISENFDKEIAPKFDDSVQRLVNDEIEKVKGLPLDLCVPYGECLKIMTGLVKPEDMHVSAAESKLVCAYNEKPVLLCLQHNIYMASKVNIDIDRFSYIAREVLEAFRECMKHGLHDLGLTIQAQKQEELPEHVVLCEIEQERTLLIMGRYNALGI
ncbi:uncharacterized protein [Typha latifolia]|uniref:uncharacterized protein isoform X2 n=1 Tax=Typha latifolia TaxID=4733 RepID=UPI003C2AC898